MIHNARTTSRRPTRQVAKLLAVALFVAAILVASGNGALPASAQGTIPWATNIQVVDGPNPGEVIITWNAVAEATHYRIGYVNMDTDYPLARASATGNWREAFVYVDVEAQNFAATGTRYTIRRLEQGARHAFAVLTNNARYGQPVWPRNPNWVFLVVAETTGPDPGSVGPGVPPPAPAQAGGDCYAGQRLSPGQSCVRPIIRKEIFGVVSGGEYHLWGGFWTDGHMSVRDDFVNFGRSAGPGLPTYYLRAFRDGDIWVIEKADELRQ